MKYMVGIAALSGFFGFAVVELLDAVKNNSELKVFWAGGCLYSFCMAISVALHEVVSYYKQKEK